MRKTSPKLPLPSLWTRLKQEFMMMEPFSREYLDGRCLFIDMGNMKEVF